VTRLLAPNEKKRGNQYRKGNDHEVTKPCVVRGGRNEGVQHPSMAKKSARSGRIERKVAEGFLGGGRCRCFGEREGISILGG